MNEEEVPFEEKVEETMLGPLWARARFSQKYPELLYDQKAIELVKNIDYDFSKIKEYLKDWRGLGLMARAKNFDLEVNDYINENPMATVVNLGAGLDTSYYRLDNGKLLWYELDLPNAIEYRKSLLKESERCKFIPKSILDYSWFDEIQFSSENGIFFIAGGLVYYFKEKEISELFINMAEIFKGGEIVFDATSKLANKIVNKRAKKLGEDLRFHFGVGNPKKLFPKWSPKIELKDWYTIWSNTKINPEWDKKVIRSIKKAERLKAAKIVHLKFN